MYFGLACEIGIIILLHNCLAFDRLYYNLLGLQSEKVYTTQLIDLSIVRDIRSV